MSAPAGPVAAPGERATRSASASPGPTSPPTATARSASPRSPPGATAAKAATARCRPAAVAAAAAGNGGAVMLNVDGQTSIGVTGDHSIAVLAESRGGLGGVGGNATAGGNGGGGGRRRQRWLGRTHHERLRHPVRRIRHRRVGPVDRWQRRQRRQRGAASGSAAATPSPRAMAGRSASCSAAACSPINMPRWPCWHSRSVVAAARVDPPRASAPSAARARPAATPARSASR